MTADGKKVKQKSHKKKKREIDKLAVTPTSLQPGTYFVTCVNNRLTDSHT